MRTVKRRFEPQERLNDWYDEAVAIGVQRGVMAEGDDKSIEAFLRRVEREEEERGGGATEALRRWPMVEGDYLPMLIDYGVKEQLSPPPITKKTDNNTVVQSIPIGCKVCMYSHVARVSRQSASIDSLNYILLPVFLCIVYRRMNGKKQSCLTMSTGASAMPGQPVSSAFMR